MDDRDANLRIDEHEKLCTLRYQELMLSQQAQNVNLLALQQDVKILLAAMNMGFGMWKLVAATGVIASVLVAVFKLGGK